MLSLLIIFVNYNNVMDGEVQQDISSYYINGDLKTLQQ